MRMCCVYEKYNLLICNNLKILVYSEAVYK
jgi:hypothetical protein